MRLALIIALSLGPILGLADPLAALDLTGLNPEAKGLAIAEEADSRNDGYDDTRAVLKMTLKNPAGKTSERDLRILTLEVPEEDRGDKSMVVFDSPKDVEGTALLTFSKILEPDDQWLYLPTLKRVKRISSVNKSGPFVGSEFSYEDMAAPEVPKYSYVWLRDEACGEMSCHVIELTPLYDYSGYTKQIAWIDTEEFRTLRTDYYDRKGALLKTLFQAGWQLHEGKFWRSHDQFMQNHQTGKSTRLQWLRIDFGTGLGDGDFTQQSLKAAG